MPSMRNTRITLARAATRSIGADLSPGDTHRSVCPWCDGGRSREASYYVTRTDDGSGVLYVCHRASCGKRGRLSLGSLGGAPEQDIRRVPSPQPWSGSIAPMESDYWLSRYCAACDGKYMQRPAHVGLYASASDPEEAVWVLRGINGQRLGVQRRKDVGKRKIVNSHKDGEESLYAAFCGGKQECGLWIVEDCLSAAGLQSWGRSAVALLGTYLHNDVRMSLCNSMYPAFIVALDPGAERDAGLVKSRLECYTTRPVHVLYMPKDFKNMRTDEKIATLTRGRV